MIDAKQWAKRLRLARSEAVRSDEEIGTGFLTRAESVIRDAQLDAQLGSINDCLHIAQEAMNDAPRLQRPGLGKVVDKLADLALDVRKRSDPKAGG
jgi:hypothetical protein